ncbi:MAG: ATP-binding protein [Desulfocapsaceae bacterium]|nr:ATP-binding protein [Desulfocapsaceae bacterium]
MPFKLRKNDHKIIELLLDIYADKTTLPVAYFDIYKKIFIWSKKGKYAPICNELNGQCNQNHKFCAGCTSDHEKRSQNPQGNFEICYVGLWNIALPIEIGGRVVGVLLSGQRKISDNQKSAISNTTFENFLEGITDNNKKVRLRKCFNETQAIDENEFNSNLLNNLKEFQEIFFEWIYEQQKDIREFRQHVHTLAHEFLIPIQAIIADSENLFVEQSEPELKRISKNILDEMQKLGIIAENMRSSILGAKYYQYEFSNRNIFEILTKSIDLYQSEANQKNVVIKSPSSLSGNFPIIELEYKQMQIAINNLLQNAVKYSFSGAGGPLFIHIYCRQESNIFTISFSNIGTGILPEEIESNQIFEAGYRGKLSADRHRTGSGLGLSEVKRIMELHNGFVEISSDKTKSDAYKTTVKIGIPIAHGRL